MSSLYKHTASPALDPDTFRHPGSEFRGAPFWSWNDHLDRARLLRQLETFPAMGIGGVTIHPRTGLDTPFMGEEFLDHVEACVDAAAAKGMLTWLYDEDRWPSGFAGGLVTCDEAYRVRWLLFTRTPYREGEIFNPGNNHRPVGPRNGTGIPLARWAVRLDSKGALLDYRRLSDGQTAQPAEEVWHALLETALATAPWYNNQAYVDTLNPAATRRFTEVVHDRFHARVGQHFGKSIPAIFTDEPQFAQTRLPDHGLDKRDCYIPWTGDFAATHLAATGVDALDTLPEVFWERADGAASPARWRFRDHISDRFAAGFADVLGAWCEQHGIALTGHLMLEPGLAEQTEFVGETMRSYRAFQIPGIDVLTASKGDVDYRTALQCRSAKHQDGREAMLSELYGVTDWDFPFSGYKAQGDWQAALGVTVRVHHLTWVSMRGEAKRDYPASIGYQSPWWREFPVIEDHFARLNTALTRGRPGVNVAVLHPIESFWLMDGPRAETAAAREDQDTRWKKLLEWLLHGLVDFDLISESRLPAICSAGGAPLQVGTMAYDTIIVPPLLTMRASTLERLEAFASAGGRLIFLGDAPALVEVQPDERPAKLAARAQRIPCERASLLAALQPARLVDVRLPNGLRPYGLMHQLRIDGDRRILFVCNPDHRSSEHHGTSYPECVIRFRGLWEVESLETADGSIRTLPVEHHDGWTLVQTSMHAAGHALLSFAPVGTFEVVSSKPKPCRHPVGRLEDPVKITLDEPNVLMLDQGEWRIGDGPWQPHTEFLRVDTAVRAALALPIRNGEDAQPWAETLPDDIASPVTIRLRFTTDIPLRDIRFVLEDPQDAQLTLDGQPVPLVITGWWVDEAIVTIALPDITSGEHVLELTRAYHRTSSIEWCYLLGDFSVQLTGRHARLGNPVHSLAFGDWTKQGLPFYGGNVTYHCSLTATGSPLNLHTPHLGGPLAGVALDGKDLGRITRAPWELDLGTPSQGSHALDITVFGHRRNSFGSVHLAETWEWSSAPSAWRSKREAWSDGYRLSPMGLLTEPRLLGD